MTKIQKLIGLLKHPSVLRFLLSSYFSGYLKEIGWFNAFEIQQPVDEDFRPIAWVTYPFLHFIEPRLKYVRSIFEYGSGNSTLYYSKFGVNLVSVEHDYRWYEKIRNTMPDNVELHYVELSSDGKYAKFCTELDKKFDIIIVDGRDRVNCLKSSLKSLTDNGVVVLDDSERDKYKSGIEFLIENGYRKIDFWGISPGLFYKKCTSIFYKNNNILEI